MPHAVSGNHGHDATFAVALALCHGFALSSAQARPIMQEFNARCDPPWSEKELEHKLDSAAKVTRHSRPRGYLLGERGSALSSQVEPSVTILRSRHERAVTGGEPATLAERKLRKKRLKRLRAFRRRSRRSRSNRRGTAQASRCRGDRQRPARPRRPVCLAYGERPTVIGARRTNPPELNTSLPVPAWDRSIAS